MKKFIIVGTQRTGSSALGEAIGLHPNISCGWEWTVRESLFKAITVADNALSGNFNGLSDKHKQHLLSIYSSDTECLGYRRLFRANDKWFFSPKFSPSLFLEKFSGHLNWISENSDIHVIHIIREDNVNWLKSKAISRKTGSYFGQEYKEGETAGMNVSEALKRVEAKHFIDDRLSQLSETNPFIQISYEEFLSDNKFVAQEVIRFLGEDASLLPNLDEVMLAKPQTGTKPVQSILENYQEIFNSLNTKELLTYVKKSK